MPRRRQDPPARDRSYAAYLASWDELEWESVWVFAPTRDGTSETGTTPYGGRTTSGVRARGRRQQGVRRWVASGFAGRPTAGALLWLGLAAAAAVAITAVLTSVAIPLLTGGLAAAAVIVWAGSRWGTRPRVGAAGRGSGGACERGLARGH